MKNNTGMIEIDGTITSIDVVREKFVCDIDTCKGACCVEGDGGAPLEDSEIVILSNHLHSILPFVAPSGKTIIMEKSFYYTDNDGDKVTMLVGGKECVFACFEDGVASCGIEKAYLGGLIPFRKPISCYLYPIRITRYASYDAVNYHRWSVCACACKKGKNEGVRVHEFLKKPLVEHFGEEWYKVLCQVAIDNDFFDDIPNK